MIITRMLMLTIGFFGVIACQETTTSENKSINEKSEGIDSSVLHEDVTMDIQDSSFVLKSALKHETDYVGLTLQFNEGIATIGCTDFKDAGKYSFYNHKLVMNLRSGKQCFEYAMSDTTLELKQNQQLLTFKKE